MIRITGRYRNGVGHFKNRPIEAFQKATGETLHKGTINVEVDHPVEFREHFRVGEEVPKMVGWSGDYLFEICRIESKWAYRVKGGHPPNIVEIMSASWITKDGQPLKDGDEKRCGTLRILAQIYGLRAGGERVGASTEVTD